MANLHVQRKARTRERLLDTALELFQDHGYVATTIDDIASAAGTTRVTFYAHFPNKVDLVRALFARLNAILARDSLDDDRSTATHLVEAVRIGTAGTLRPWLADQAARWQEIKPYIGATDEAAAVDSEMHALKYGWHEEVIDDLVAGMSAADRFSPDERRYRGFLAMELLVGSNRRWNGAPWPVTGSREFDVLADAWVHLLGTPES